MRSMKYGKHQKQSKKPIALILALTAILCAVVGGTIAFVMVSTDTVENKFTPSTIDITVDEDFDGVEKSSIKINNTKSNVDVYARVAIVTSWETADGGFCMAHDEPTISVSEDWFKGSDGYYYCKNAIPAGGSSKELLSAPIILIQEDDGCKMQVNVAASAIQAIPDTAVESAWPAVEVSEAEATRGQLVAKVGGETE